jgi:hypothetical protein
MYGALVSGYGSAAVVLLAAGRRRRDLWPPSAPEGGLRLTIVIPLLVAVLLIGELFRRGLLLPSGDWPVLARMANQFLIFSPVFVAATIGALRGPDVARRVAFMPKNKVWLRLACGIAAAGVALIAYYSVSGRLSQLPASAAAMLSPPLLAYAVQILGEDLAIGMLLAASLRRLKPWLSIVACGLLFAASHVPAMIAADTSVADFARLVADGLLAAGIVALLLRLRDVWLIWPVHVAMDLTQFVKL